MTPTTPMTITEAAIYWKKLEEERRRREERRPRVEVPVYEPEPPRPVVNETVVTVNL